MKVVVFGPTRGVGRALVSQALERGLEVTAFARTPSKIDVSAPRLAVVQGDVLDPGAVDRAVAGQDAVLCALGGQSLIRTDRTCSEGTRAIVAAMERHGVRRLVVCTSMGVGESRPHLPFLGRIFLRKALDDKDIQEDIVRRSDTDWVIVRPTGLRDDAPRADVAVVMSGPVPTNRISRADVARFMLDQLVSDEYLRKTPAISWR